MAPKFSPGAKVFAKVRGYPPWPARIEGCADESPNKMKYHVYFYGTGETAIVKSQDVFDFVENKGKFGFVKKHKNFAEAIQQIEADLSPVQKAALSSVGQDKLDSPAVKESVKDKDVKEAEVVKKEVKVTPSVESTTSNDSSPALPSNRRASTTVKTPKPATPAVSKPAINIKRKLESEPSSEDPTPKKTNTSPTTVDKDNKPNPEVMSRSGRKIKPKKFSDFDDSKEDSKDGMGTPDKKPDEKTDKKEKPVEDKKKEPKKTARPKSSMKDSDDVDSNSGDWYLLAAHGKENIKIPIKLNRPNYEDNKERSMSLNSWENMVFEEARSLKKRIESGEEFTETEATDYMERFTKVKAASVFVLRSPEEEEQYRRQTYNAESTLLDIELQIRTALSLKGADTKACLQQLDRLKNLRVTALMLKKHSQIVQTIKKLRRYVGNTIFWDLTDEEAQEFNVDAEKIRAKAEEIVNSFKTLFFQPTNSSFWDHFSSELAEFNAKTKHMTIEDVFAIITEPE